MSTDELRKELDAIFPPPATSTRGQGGLPLHGSVTDYAMHYTKDGKEFIYEKLLLLIDKAVLDGKIEELTTEQFSSNPTYRLERLAELEKQKGEQ